MKRWKRNDQTRTAKHTTGGSRKKRGGGRNLLPESSGTMRAEHGVEGGRVCLEPAVNHVLEYLVRPQCARVFVCACERARITSVLLYVSARTRAQERKKGTQNSLGVQGPRAKAVVACLAPCLQHVFQNQGRRAMSLSMPHASLPQDATRAHASLPQDLTRSLHTTHVATAYHARCYCMPRTLLTAYHTRAAV